MAKTELDRRIEEATQEFALSIVDAIRSSTLEDLIKLQTTDSAPTAPIKRRGRPPKVQTEEVAAPAKRRGRPPKVVPTAEEEKRVVRRGRPPKVQPAEEEAAPKKKKRVVKNYPKCAFPKCDNNRFVRGKGFCGKHWKEFLAGKIKSADTYSK